MAYLNSELLNEMGAMDMTFSKVTQDIMARLQRWRAAGDPYADRKLAENIDAAIGKRPLPSYSEENPATRAQAPLIADRKQLREENRKRACRKILEGRPLDEEEEDAMVFGDLDR
jgi:hypothetical protein